MNFVNFCSTLHFVPRMHIYHWNNTLCVACVNLYDVNAIVMRHKVKLCALADFNAVNRENKESCQGKRFSERLSFTRFCANGNRPAFIGGGSERDEIAVK